MLAPYAGVRVRSRLSIYLLAVHVRQLYAVWKWRENPLDVSSLNQRCVN